MEAQTILDAIKRSQFNRLGAASELGIHKGMLHPEIKLLELSPDKKDGLLLRR
jgi:hypothetical protein